MIVLRKLRRQSEHRKLLEKHINLLKYKSKLSKTFEVIFTNQKESIRFFEKLPFGKEIKNAFEVMNLRLGEKFTNANEWYKTSVLKDFMFNFYKTLLISIDKKNKLSKDIGIDEVKEAIKNRLNHVELKKAIDIFDCKFQNNYFEFSKNGFIELYTQGEFLRLLTFLELKTKVEDYNNFKQNNRRNSLKEDEPNYKLYKEITKIQILNALNEKNISLTKIVKEIEGRENYSGDLYDTFDKWKTENIENGQYENLILEVRTDLEES